MAEPETGRPESGPPALRFPGSRLLILAKAPRSGQVKTRLIPPLTPAEAADLQRHLLLETLERLARSRLAPVELWCSPDTDLDPFPMLAAEFGVRLHRQEDGDLGERMLRAAEQGLAASDSVVLVGADCPGLDADYAARALGALGHRDAVIGPAEDGGYVLLGLKRAEPALFAGIPWGTDRVLAVTRQRMATLGWCWTELETLWDLDRPADLQRYRERLAGPGSDQDAAP